MGVITAFGTARDDKRDTGCTCVSIQRVEEGNGRTMQMHGVGHLIVVPGGIHAMDAAPFVEIALAEIFAHRISRSKGIISRCREDGRHRAGALRAFGRKRGNQRNFAGKLALCGIL